MAGEVELPLEADGGGAEIIGTSPVVLVPELKSSQLNHF